MLFNFFSIFIHYELSIKNLTFYGTFPGFKASKVGLPRGYLHSGITIS
jgi:hypothetical protein